MKNYTQAPLPFQGQKRKFIKLFQEALTQYPDVPLFIDLFGGSGLLSHTVKQRYPKARVIWNDFDNYCQRIKNIDKTNKLLKDIRIITAGQPDNKKIDVEVKNQIIARISQEKGFVDYITLSSSLLFSMKYVLTLENLKKETFYNCVKQSNYEATGYLANVEVIRADYKKVYEQYKDVSGVCFLIDPPYLSTDSTTYSSNAYWKLTDYLDVLKVLKGKNYFYFTSNKSHVVELCDWMATNTGAVNPFSGAITKTVSTTVNYSGGYTDIMIFKKK